MSDIQTLSKTKQAHARVKLIDALWADSPADEILQLATDAGISPKDADRLATEIADGRQDKILVDTLPVLQNKADLASAALEKISIATKAKIAALQAETRVALQLFNNARDERGAAESALNRLQSLVARSKMPPELLPTSGNEAGEHERQAIHKAWISARDRVKTIRSAIGDIVDLLEKMKLGNTDEIAVQGEIHTLEGLVRKLAQRRLDLPRAEDALEVAAIKAGFAVPAPVIA